VKALVRARAITVTPPVGQGKPFLVAELHISCDICGEHTVTFAGHHLRPIVALFQEFIEACPELTAEGDVEVVGRREYDFPFDPENN